LLHSTLFASSTFPSVIGLILLVKQTGIMTLLVLSQQKANMIEFTKLIIIGHLNE
jgi:hypothetical protein